MSCALDYPRHYRSNLDYRCGLTERALQDKELRDQLFENCRRDIRYWLETFGWTYDPREAPEADRPFVLYGYQVEYLDYLEGLLQGKSDGVVEKSRDMGASWLTLAWLQWHWQFDASFQALIGSRKEDLVDQLGVMDSLFEKIRYNLRRQPRWLLPEGFDINENAGYCKIVNPATGSTITGESTNRNFSRQGRYNVVLVDEFAFCPNADAIWQAMSDSTRTRVVISTPRGKMNLFARLARKKQGNAKKFRMHWKQHPKKDAAWFAEESKRRTEREIAEELDINYIASAGKPFYAGFKEDMHCRSLAWLKGRPVYRGMDFGYHHPAVVWCQKDVRGRMMILAALLGEDIGIRRFCREQVVPMENQLFPGAKFETYCDPAGKQVSDKDETLTSIQIVEAELKTKCNYRQSNYTKRREVTERLLKALMDDGIPSLVVQKDGGLCELVVEAFLGGYHFPENDGRLPEKDTPFRDGFYEHLMNAFEYIMVNIFMVVEAKHDDDGYESAEERYGS